jgi:hypothetical protein
MAPPVSPGAIVWVVLGAAVVCWGTLSALVERLPGPIALVRFFTRSWLGRVLALCAWGGAGWHLFCQRP